MTDVEVKVIGLDEVRDFVGGLPERMFDVAKEEISKSTLSVHETVSNRVRKGTPLFSRTGQLRRSLKTKVAGTTINTLSGSVYSDGSVASYAPTHEFGATIRAKNAYKGVPGGPYLNIPLPLNKTPSGIMKLSAKDVFARGGFLVRGPLRYVVMMPLSTAPLTKPQAAAAAGFGQYSIPMFVLVKEVTIPARLGLYDTAENEVPTLLSNLSKATGKAIKE